MYWSHWWFPFPWFFLTFLLVFVLFRFILFRRGWRGRGYSDDRLLDAESILKRRLASGQITEAEYQRLLQIVRT